MSTVEYGNEGGEYPNPRLSVSPKWLLEHLDDPDVRIVDMRNPMQYMMRHIPNSIHVPYELILDMKPDDPSLGVASKESVEMALGEYGIDEKKTVVVYGNFENLAPSRFLWTLEYYGHPDVRILNLDFSRWVRDGLKGTREVPKIEKTRFLARTDESKVAVAPYILSKLGDRSVAILDNRSPMEYFSQVPTGARPGRIPGSINLPHYSCMEEGRLFRRASELKVVFESKGIFPEKEVVTYCHVGERSAHTYIVLRLLNYQKVRLYVKSYSEWGNNPSLPVEI